MRGNVIGVMLQIGVSLWLAPQFYPPSQGMEVRLPHWPVRQTCCHCRAPWYPDGYKAEAGPRPVC
ncbi:hypothetical protein [Streptomyces sp. NPDC002573]|uniref:hypothetical protein n=1 Tax=Streptomyces sp. NPDC002573 TaxID=3364651 RepID=UPI0036C7FFC1